MIVVFLIVRYPCLISGFDVIQGNLYIKVLYNGNTNPSVVYLHGGSVKLTCQYFTSSHNAASFGDAEWVKIEDSHTVSLSSTIPVVVDQTTKQIDLTVSTIGTYSCQYKNGAFPQEVKVEDGKHTVFEV